MGANRKLQIEIDRTLKKVNEGIEVFDEIWDKVYETDQVALKEKYELDLKKEIKKLQRYRDTIKTWISGSDIKDKTVLIEARKSVERQMERFKVCEKETKTKMFSKEGLAQAQKQDPREKAKNEIKDWINTTVDTLTTEAENFDAEVESLTSTKKKGKPPPRLAHAEESAVRHRAHITRLEQILRLLDNEAIEPEDVAESKEMVEDYLQRNQDDFDDFADPDELYTDLLEQLDNLESQQPAAVNHIGKTSGIKDKETKDREKEREKERSAALAMKMQLAQGGHNVVIEEASPEKPPPPPAPRKPAETRQPPAPKQPPPPARGDQSARQQSTDLASESQHSIPDSAPSTPMRPALPVARQDPSTAGPPQVKEENRQLQGAAANTSAAPGGQLPGQLPPVVTTSFAAAAASGALNSPAASLRTPTSGPSDQAHSLESGRGMDPGRILPADPQSNSQVVPTQGPSRAQPPQGGMHSFSIGWQTANDAEPSPSALDTVRAEETQVVDSLPQSSNMAEISDTTDSHGPSVTAPTVGYSLPQLQLLSASAARFMPTTADRMWGPPSFNKLMPTGLPASYPDVKIGMVENPALFEKLEAEALFFAFYYQPDTYQQYLAAKELKKQSWRFHKQHGSWFQRHEEPHKAEDSYEMGTYVYFDYNIIHDEQSGWCYRLKQDFIFKYDALEDELV